MYFASDSLSVPFLPLANWKESNKTCTTTILSILHSCALSLSSLALLSTSAFLYRVCEYVYAIASFNAHLLIFHRHFLLIFFEYLWLSKSCTTY